VIGANAERAVIAGDAIERILHEGARETRIQVIRDAVDVPCRVVRICQILHRGGRKIVEPVLLIGLDLEEAQRKAAYFEWESDKD